MGYFSKDDTSGVIKQMWNEIDSLKAVELLDDPVEQARLAEENRVAGIEKARLDSLKLVELGLNAANKEEIARRNASRERAFEKYGKENYENAYNSMTDYMQYKSDNNVDEVELKYYQLMDENTSEDGTYMLENYETYAMGNADWNNLYNKIAPTGIDKFNPFWAPNEDDLRI